MRIAVPVLIQRRIAKAEVTPDIDDGPALTEPRARLLRGLAGRKCREHDLGVVDLAAHDERIRRVVQVWLRRAERFALVRPGDDGDGPRRTVEARQKPVARAIDFDATEDRKLALDLTVMPNQQVAPTPVTYLREKLGRADDVGRDEGRQEAIGGERCGRPRYELLDRANKTFPGIEGEVP